MHLYSRQILLEGWDIDAQEKLKLANILIVGCGGIGCSSAELSKADKNKISHRGQAMQLFKASLNSAR